MNDKDAKTIEGEVAKIYIFYVDSEGFALLSTEDSRFYQALSKEKEKMRFRKLKPL